MQQLEASLSAGGELNLDRYFARIGYTGTPRPDLETLRALTELHPATIPFEGVDAFLGLAGRCGLWGPRGRRSAPL